MTDIAALRILLVEDHGFQRWLMSDLLNSLGARAIESVADGKAALQALGAGGSFDLVVSDLDMPGVDGMELFRRMAEQGHRAGLIVVSAHEPHLLASVEAMAREYGLNFVATIPKPLTARKFETALAAFVPASRVEQHGLSFTRDEIAAGLRRNEFTAFFQPKVQIPSGRVQGVEALARWRHPYRGLVTPSAFLGVVETTDLMALLTECVVRDALAACRSWTESGEEISVAVNLSAALLSDAGLADRMIGLAGEAGVDPPKVTFEVTESAATPNAGKKLENLTRLRMRGFELSIDDFGTGYSSMQRLSNVPFTELKIDQLFVRNAERDGASLAIVDSSVQLANRLGMRSVAEGVETATQWTMLLGMGCGFAQGHFISEPMDATRFVAWLEERKRGCA